MRNKPKVSALNTRRKEIKTGVANALSSIGDRGSPAVSKPKVVYKGYQADKVKMKQYRSKKTATADKGTNNPLEDDYSAPKMNQVTPNTSNAMSKYKTVPSMPKTLKRPAKPQMGMDAPAAKKGRPY
jgi:hypothetical protein